jgi:hypothetical protein
MTYLDLVAMAEGLSLKAIVNQLNTEAVLAIGRKGRWRKGNTRRASSSRLRLVRCA